LAESDPVAALTAQLEQLRGQLARSQGDIGHLKARLETDSGQVAMLRLEVKQLREKLDQAIAKRQAADLPAPYWLGLTQEEHAARLTDLRAWVDRVALAQYPDYMARLAPCWERHPEAVWELSTLRAEWDRIYGDEDNRDLKGALNWHGRWFPEALSRLSARIKCDELGCRAVWLV
jgi:regulator of replication initiation timing